MKKYLITLALVGLATTSCYEKLNITPPNAITTEQVRELLLTADDATVVTIMGAMADALPGQFKGGSYDGWNNQYVSNFAGQLCMRTFTGNDVVVGRLAPSGDLGNFYAGLNLRTAASNMNEPYWRRGYTMSGAANKVLDMITDDLVAKNGSKKLKEYQADALITRAFGYNYLMESYQNAYLQGGKDKPGVPIYVQYGNNLPLQDRSSSQACYDSIIKWSNKAIALFTDAGVGYTKGDENAWQDIDMGVAKYVLARASLNVGDWATVISACNDILAVYPSFITQDYYVAKNVNSRAKITPEYRAENLALLNIAKNPEVLLGWTVNKGAYGSQTFWYNSFSNQTRIDSRLYSQIDDKDFRKKNFQNSDEYGDFITAGDFAKWQKGEAVSPVVLGSYINFKYANTVGINGKWGSATPNDWNVNSTDMCLIRTSEVWLMLAEAQAMSGDEAGAKTTLNKLLAARTLTGNPALTCDSYKDMTGKSVIDMVRFQWRIEMWGEVGMEWFNNRRWNIPVNRSGSLNHHNPAMTYSVADMTMQIPEQEINTNNNIKVQNP